MNTTYQWKKASPDNLPEDPNEIFVLIDRHVKAMMLPETILIFSERYPNSLYEILVELPSPPTSEGETAGTAIDIPDINSYPLGGFAPGNYQCKCAECKKTFIGDKLAMQCEPCALRAVISILRKETERVVNEYGKEGAKLAAEADEEIRDLQYQLSEYAKQSIPVNEVTHDQLCELAEQVFRSIEKESSLHDKPKEEFNDAQFKRKEGFIVGWRYGYERRLTKKPF